MPGIIKGSVFSFLLSVIFIATISAITFFADISEHTIKIVLWSLISLSTFFGSALVSIGASEKKIIKGISSTLFSVVLFYIFCVLIIGNIPATGGLLTLALIASICGLIGAFIGGLRKNF